MAGRKLKFQVTGMNCAACSARVEKAVGKVDGVSEVSVNLLLNCMVVEGTASVESIVDAVVKAGYGAIPETAGDATYPGIAGMEGSTYLDLTDAGEKASSDNMIVTEGTITEKTTDAIAGVNSVSRSKTSAKTTSNSDVIRMRNRLFMSAGFLLVLMYFSMGHMMWNFPIPPFMEGNHVAMGMLQMLLTIVIMMINKQFFVSGFKSLWHLAPNMDTLVALGSTAAFGYSTVVLFVMTDRQMAGDAEGVMWCMNNFYFESAAMILTLITVGKMLEAMSKGRTTDALKSLMKLAPQTATLLRDGKEITVPVTGVRAGDMFAVKPGESIPTDGEVIKGSGAVDESALTGESIPVDKEPGSAVYAATINSSGYLICRATRVGADTSLSKIIQMVSDAAASKAPIAKIADKVSGMFVPAVMGIALVTIIVWLATGHEIGYALARGISVLVISCPCALGLATPVAIMVGSGVGARKGILFKTAAALEETGKVRIVALDKTGTITTGHPVVTDVVPAPGVEAEELLEAAYALEKRSEHPLAKAVTEYVEHIAGTKCVGRKISEEESTCGITSGTECACEMNPGLPDDADDLIEDFCVLPGNGLKATRNGETIIGGSLTFIMGVTQVSQITVDAATTLSTQGKTPMLFVKGDKVLGMIAVADTIRPDSAAAIREMQKMGIHVVMLTGDNRHTAEAIGHIAGVDEIIAEVLPEGKAAAIEELRKKGKVAMVGDGINDAPALTCADIGIAIGAGTDVAIDAADVVLMKSSLQDAVTAFALSRATLRNIKQNLFWAFFYNTIGIPLAAGVWIPFFGWELDPMFGAAAMSLSSFCVVTNALRLNLFGRRNKFVQEEMKPAGEINRQELNYQRKGESKMTKTIKIKGMMCGHCEATVKKTLEAFAEIDEAVVSHDAGTAVVTCNAPIDEEAVKKAIADKDFEVLGIE